MEKGGLRMARVRKSTTEGGYLLTVDQVSRLLNVPTGEVYQLAARGELPGLKVGRYWRFPPDLIERLIEGDSDDRRSS
jgi:excisionase family DNA binding protein